MVSCGVACLAHGNRRGDFALEPFPAGIVDVTEDDGISGVGATRSQTSRRRPVDGARRFTLRTWPDERRRERGCSSGWGWRLQSTMAERRRRREGGRERKGVWWMLRTKTKVVGLLECAARWEGAGAVAKIPECLLLPLQSVGNFLGL